MPTGTNKKSYTIVRAYTERQRERVRERRGRGREREGKRRKGERQREREGERKKGERERERDYDQFPTYLTYQHHLQQTSLQYGQRHKVQHLISYSNLLGHGRTDWTVSWATRLQFGSYWVMAALTGPCLGPLGSSFGSYKFKPPSQAIPGTGL